MTFRSPAHAPHVALSVVVCTAMLLLGALFWPSSADAQEADGDIETLEVEPPERPIIAIDGSPILPPPEITIERLLYASAFDANPSFDCSAPTTAIVDHIEDAAWACYTITNTSSSFVDQFTLSDPEMRPAHTFVPFDFDEYWIFPNEVIEYQLEVTSATVAYGSSAPFNGDSDDYEIALFDLYEAGITDLNVTDYAGWGLYSLPLTTGETAPVSLAVQGSKWDALGIDNYEFTFTPSCFCYYAPESMPPYRIRVIDGIVESATVISSGIDAPAWTSLTIDDMLERIADASDPLSPAWQTAGTFDVLYGLPTTWFIDESIAIADEEFGGRIEDFTPLRVCDDGYAPFPSECAPALAADGDVDCSGQTDIIDALLIVLYEVDIATDLGACPEGQALAAPALYADRGDVNGDGFANILDALVIARCTAGLESEYCDQMPLWQ